MHGLLVPNFRIKIYLLFPALYSRFCFIADALLNSTSTVPEYSISVCSQTCDQKSLSEHPRDKGQKAIFHSLLGCYGRMIRRSGLPHCTADGEAVQALCAGIGSAKFVSL